MPRTKRAPRRIKPSRSGAAVVVPKNNEAGHDLELLKLSRQLDLLVQRYDVARQRFLPVDEAHTRLVEEWREAHPGYNIDQFHAAWVETYNDLREGVGEHPDNVMNDVDGVSRAIVAISATT